jgi:hypothetical protein
VSWLVQITSLTNPYCEKDGVLIILLDFHHERYSKRPLTVKIIYGIQSSEDESTIGHLHVERLDLENVIDYHSCFSIFFFSHLFDPTKILAWLLCIINKS